VPPGDVLWFGGLLSLKFANILNERRSFVRQLGKYGIISEIGRGAMEAVYKARDPFIDRLVALKTITSGLSA
jgi:serine/threonine protein kinase